MPETPMQVDRQKPWDFCRDGEHDQCTHLGFSGDVSLFRRKSQVFVTVCTCDCHSECPGLRRDPEDMYEACTC